jgi:hypothetical protein
MLTKDKNQKALEPHYTSVAIKREDYENITKLSTKIINGVRLTVPQTIKFLVNYGLTRHTNNKDKGHDKFYDSERNCK